MNWWKLTKKNQNFCLKAERAMGLSFFLLGSPKMKHAIRTVSGSSLPRCKDMSSSRRSPGWEINEYGLFFGVYRSAQTPKRKVGGDGVRRQLRWRKSDKTVWFFIYRHDRWRFEDRMAARRYIVIEVKALSTTCLSPINLKLSFNKEIW